MFNSNILMDNLKAKNNLNKIPHGKRNQVARSISPLGNNNTTNSIHKGQEKSSENNSNTKETNNSNNNINPKNSNNINTIILDKLNVKIERKSSNDQGKFSHKSSNNNVSNPNNNRTSIKKDNDNKKTLQVNSALTKKESISTNSKGNNGHLDIKKITTSQLNNNTITISTINVDKDANKGKHTILKVNNNEQSKKPEQKKIEINLDKKLEVNMDKKVIVVNKKDDGSLKNLSMKKSLDNLEKLQNSNKKNQESSASFKTKGNSNKDNKEKEDLDNIVSGQNIKEFACCSISNNAEIIEKITKYCFDNKVILTDTGNSVYECKNDNYTVGLQFSIVKGGNVMKIYQIGGLENSAKELMKAIINLVF